MRTVMGQDCWPGKAEGIIVWLPRVAVWSGATGTPVVSALVPAERKADEIRSFRMAVGQAVESLEGWSEQQETLAQRVLLQEYKEALLADAWSRRACALIDIDGVPAAAAAVQAAIQIGMALTRSSDLTTQADRLLEAAGWVAARLEPPQLAETDIVAAPNLSSLDVLDLRHPALMAGPEPAVRGAAPLVWGVPDLGPAWHGRRIGIDGRTITLDLPDPRWWSCDGDRLGSYPLCVLNGSLNVIDAAARRSGRPAVLVRRLDDLAALPLYVGNVSAIALDLDALGPAPRLKHPGFLLLLNAALATAKAHGVPVLAGGEPAVRQPDRWLSLGLTALFQRSSPRGGSANAVRGRP